MSSASRASKSPGKRRSGAVRRSPKPAARPPTPTGRTHRGWLVLFGLLGVAALSVAPVLVWATLAGPGETRPVVATFSGEETPSEMGERLRALGLTDSPRLFAIYLGWFAPKLQVAPGTHLLRAGLSPRRLAQRLGRLPSRPSARVTLPEGYTHLQFGERLEAKDICTRAELTRAVRNGDLARELGVPGTSVEGYLFPATYELLVDSDPVQIVRQLVAETRKRLARLDERHAGALGRLASARRWSERDVLTLASIVEREAANPEERRLVASVFFNRLDDPTFRPARMLQSDPTAGYGCLIGAGAAASCAGYAGKITPEMLRDVQNPYNTYRHAGLPPGPIGNPGEGAIEAVLTPTPSDYLYFVADGRGRHRFSRSFEEHRRAIERRP